MHPSLPFAAVLVLAASTAHALTIDAKALARFDISYAKCETQFPAMRGHRDESYLSLWRVNADKKARAQLAEVRKGAPYQAERRLVLHGTAPSASAPASAVLQHQCQALWAETQRVEKLKQ